MCIFLEWSSWGEWGSCNVDCGEGKKTRSRTCENGEKCKGDSIERKNCKGENCPGNISI